MLESILLFLYRDVVTIVIESYVLYLYYKAYVYFLT